MERRNPRSAYSHQKSVSDSSSGTSAAAVPPSSPTMSPMNRHLRSGSAGVGNLRRNHNHAARAAAQRLAKVMATAADDEDGSNSDENSDDDLESIIPIGLSTPRRTAGNRSPSPGLGRHLSEQPSSVRTSAGRPSMVAKQPAMIPPIKPSPRPVITSASADPPVFNRREVTLVASESPVISKRDDRVSIDLGALNMRETSSSRSSSTVQDEIDGLHEEHENVLQKLQLAEERYEEAEARTRQRERQAASRATTRNSFVKREDIVPLQMEAKVARNETVSTTEHLQEVESELRSLRTLAQSMMLSKEQMEEVVLKRCWLARYWKLCVQYGIHADIAERKHEYWSSLAPLPVEVVLSAGEKARDGCLSGKADMEEKVPFDISDLSGEGNIENMLLVEKSMRELTSLKVEDAVQIIMAQQRRANVKTVLSNESSCPVEAFELSMEEKDDVLFKQAWLTYFWRRVKNHGLEEDIADERLQFWIDQSNHSPTSQDAVEVERGLFELKKWGIEGQLWETCRRGTERDSSHHGSQTESEY